jgi:hypothetical protein
MWRLDQYLSKVLIKEQARGIDSDIILLMVFVSYFGVFFRLCLRSLWPSCAAVVDKDPANRLRTLSGSLRILLG